MARCYCGCGTINNRIAHVLLLLAFLAGCALAGWGIAIIQPCHAQLMDCQQQQSDLAAKRAACTPQFSTCSDAGWRRVIGALLLYVACALGSSYFCCCAQRPPEALGCCCNCCHPGKPQQQQMRPAKMVQRPPVPSMPGRLPYGYPPGAPPPGMQRVHMAGAPVPHQAARYSTYQPAPPTASFHAPRPASFHAPPPPPPPAAAAAVVSRPGMVPAHHHPQQQMMGLSGVPHAGYPSTALTGSYADVQPVARVQQQQLLRPVTGTQPVPLHSAVNVPVAIQ